MLYKSSFQSGRSMLELLAVIVIICLLSLTGIILYRKAIIRHEGEVIYQDILTVVSSVRSRGTGRNSDAGIADTQLAYDKTRFGQEMQVVKDCPKNAFLIKIKDINKDLCEYLTDKDYPSLFKPIAFYRSKKFGDICKNNDLESDTTGYYMTSGADCSKNDSADAFVVVFDMRGKAGEIKTCKENSDCYTCQTCNKSKQLCEDNCEEGTTCSPTTQKCEAECEEGQYLDEGQCKACPEPTEKICSGVPESDENGCPTQELEDCSSGVCKDGFGCVECLSQDNCSSDKPFCDTEENKCYCPENAICPDPENPENLFACNVGYYPDLIEGICLEDKCFGKELNSCQICDPSSGEVIDKGNDEVCDLPGYQQKGYCLDGTCINSCNSVDVLSCQSCEPNGTDTIITQKPDNTICEFSSLDGFSMAGKCSAGECLPISCASGQFVGSKQCCPCPEDEYGVLSCNNAGLRCKAGYYKTTGACPTCEECEWGSYSEGGATSCNPCSSCPYGYHSNWQQNGCVMCEAGEECCTCPPETPLGDGVGGCTANACIRKTSECYISCTTETDEEGEYFANVTTGCNAGKTKCVTDFKTTCTLPGYSGKKGLCYDGECYNECNSRDVGECKICTPNGASVTLTNKTNGTVCKYYDFEKDQELEGKCWNGTCSVTGCPSGTTGYKAYSSSATRPTTWIKGTDSISQLKYCCNTTNPIPVKDTLGVCDYCDGKNWSCDPSKVNADCPSGSFCFNSGDSNGWHCHGKNHSGHHDDFKGLYYVKIGTKNVYSFPTARAQIAKNLCAVWGKRESVRCVSGSSVFSLYNGTCYGCKSGTIKQADYRNCDSQSEAFTSGGHNGGYIYCIE